MLKISVVVPFYNTQRHIEACLGALRDQDYPQHQYEVIAIDNNSRDASADIARRSSHVNVLCESKQGPYAARNTGIRASRGEIIAFTDPDCLPSSDWLATIDRTFQSVTTRLVLGRSQPASASLPISLISDYEHEKNTYICNNDMKEIYCGHTNNMAVLSSTFDTLGLFEERDRGSDTIFVNRCVERYGCDAILYKPEMRVQHLELESLGRVFKKYFVYGRSAQKYRRSAPVRSLYNRERLAVWQKMTRRRRLPRGQTALSLALLATGWVYWTAGEMVSKLNTGQSSQNEPCSKRLGSLQTGPSRVLQQQQAAGKCSTK